ncbi:MAG: hypothetical protein J07HX5_00504 [halophilic archaeon J07HX5]|nr:MAG: hypothetical protein J07HX5_00504 [halophilic archaeon J07HX5]
MLATGRVMRLERFDGVDGLFAATQTGLYRRTAGDWTDLSVPREQVYAVGAAQTGRLFAGTRPAAVYTTPSAAAPNWQECAGFQELPSREEWRLPRHEQLAQVRDIHVVADPDAAAGANASGDADEQLRVVAGVEVGGVHHSADRGVTWRERRTGGSDDIHELHVAKPGEHVYVAATGGGLYRSRDAGRSWARLDTAIEQDYFRTAHTHDGTVYAGGAMANSSTWNDPDADPQLVAVRDGSLEPIEIPFPDETVTGLATIGASLHAVTHCGRVLQREGPDWTELATVPTPRPVTGRYTPLTAA